MTTSAHDVDAEPTAAGRLWTAGAQGEITHLALDAAGHDASPAGAHVLGAQFVEHELARLPLARLVLRGEWLPHGAASGA